MVVQCTNCNSRFRVADERVPDKGVKVRCTKCSTVFRVTRADAIDAKQAHIDGPTPREVSPPAAVALPGLDDLPPPPPLPPPGRTPPVPPPVSFTYGAASPNLSLDFDLDIPPPPPPPVTPRSPTPPAKPANPIMNAIDAALDAAMSSDDPFSDLPAAPPSIGLVPPREATPPPQGPSSIDLFGDRAAADHLASAVAGLELDQPPAPFSFPTPQSMVPQESGGRMPPAPQPREETDPFAGLNAPPSYGSTEAPPPYREATRPPPVRELTQPPPAAPEPGMVPSSNHEIDLPEGTSRSSLDLAELQDSEDRLRVARIAPIKQLSVPESKRPKLDPKTATQQRLRREFASAMLNVVSAAIVCYAGIVAIAVIRTPRPIGFHDLGFPMVWLAFGAESEGHTDVVRAANVRSGVYQTNTGEEMFYLQGQVKNDTSRRHEAMYVTLELRKGAQVLDRIEAIVGLHASPEDLYNLSSRKNDDLQELLSQRTKSTTLEPHRAASFVGVFDLSAKDIAGTDVSLVVHDGVPPARKSVNPPRKADAATTKPPVAADTDKPVEASNKP